MRVCVIGYEKMHDNTCDKMCDRMYGRMCGEVYERLR